MVARVASRSSTARERGFHPRLGSVLFLLFFLLLGAVAALVVVRRLSNASRALVVSPCDELQRWPCALLPTGVLSALHQTVVTLNRCERVAAHTPDGSLADEPSRIDRQRVPPTRAGRKDVVQQRPDPAWPQARDRNRMADGGTVWNRASRWFRSRMRTPPSWLVATCLQAIPAA